MSAPVFMSEEKFDVLRAAGQLERDALFPVMEYAVCKKIWETSPLIAALLAALDEMES